MRGELSGVPTTKAPSRSTSSTDGTGKPSSPVQPLTSSSRAAPMVAERPGATTEATRGRYV